MHQVVALQVALVSPEALQSGDDVGGVDGADDVRQQAAEGNAETFQETSGAELACLSAGQALRPLKVRTTAFDSVADFKRDLQNEYGDAWGLSGRRMDHERLAIGWELVHNSVALCPNYLIRDYGVETGDEMHVVIRR